MQPLALSLSSHKTKPWNAIALTLVLLVGFGLRVYKLDQPIMWCDEAESSINSLTILNRGLPMDTYLGLPIFENTLTERWPESKEYEFRDSSYSSKGLAIYHGWLPLYSVAASFKLFGITPDTDPTNVTPLHDDEAVRLRTIAARVPAAICGLIFLILLYKAGCEMYGQDAGWAALICAAVSVPMVNIARQARYYSMTAALSAACCLAGWRMYSRGRWRDFVYAGIAFAMLFHTHLLTFAIASAAVTMLVPVIVKTHEKAWRKLLFFAGVVTLFTLPWLLMTGFLGAAQSVPKAITTMQLPDDLIAWPQRYWQITLVLMSGMAWIGLLMLKPHWISKRLSDPFTKNRAAFLFLSGWIIFGFLMFMFLIPAASLFFQRLYLGAVGPGIIFGAMLFAGFGRAIGGRIAVILAVITFVGFAYLNTRAGYWWQRNKVGQARLGELVADMRDWRTKPGTRIYASPNDHLTLTFYTGIPIQSIAPVRKSFLDSYPGDVIFIDCTVHVFPIGYGNVKTAANDYGTPVAENDLPEWTDRINRVASARRLVSKVKSTVPKTDQVPQFAEGIIKWQLAISPTWTDQYNFAYSNPAMFRGYKFDDFDKWWQVFFYRFVDPASRIGDNLNFADRMKQANARVLPTLWTVYTSPGAETAVQANQVMERR
ncbi:hypothetical protein BH10PLA1_BH10PLA1_06790 [soil metagenome]